MTKIHKNIKMTNKYNKKHKNDKKYIKNIKMTKNT